MILVTGADRTHGASLRQFLASVRRHAPALRVVVYDLGLTAWQRWRIGRRRRLELQRFEFGKYPAYFDIRVKAGEFAWKPVIVWDVLQDASEPVCWMDAGNVLTGPVSAIEAAVRKTGFYSPRSNGTILNWTHPKMLAYFGVDAGWGRNKPNLNGACVAFDPSHRGARELARRWKAGALIRECIAPEGSDLTNHRQDQALLTVLTYLEAIASVSEPGYLGFEIQRDIDRRENPTYLLLKRCMFPRGVPPLLRKLRAHLD
jgi:hypothetical protein